MGKQSTINGKTHVQLSNDEWACVLQSQGKLAGVLGGDIILAIDEHVPGCCGELHTHAVHLLGEVDLAPEPGCVRQPEGHIQHVVLVVARLLNEVIELRGQDDMARRARDRALARAWAAVSMRERRKEARDGPSRSTSCSCAIERMSSPSFASTVLISPPFASLKCSVILPSERVRSRHRPA